MKNFKQLLCLVLLGAAVSGLTYNVDAMENTVDSVLSIEDVLQGWDELNDEQSLDSDEQSFDNKEVSPEVPELPDFTPAQEVFHAADVSEQQAYLEDVLNNEEDIYHNDRENYAQQLEVIISSNMNEQEKIDGLKQLIAGLEYCARPSDFLDEEDEIEEYDSSDCSDSNETSDTGDTIGSEDISSGLSDEEIVQSIMRETHDHRSLAEKLAALVQRPVETPVVEREVEESNNTDIVDLWHKPSIFEDLQVADEEVTNQESEVILGLDELHEEIQDSQREGQAIVLQACNEEVEVQDLYDISALKTALNLSERITTSPVLKEIALLETLCSTNMLTIGQKRYFAQHCIAQKLRCAGMPYRKRSRALDSSIKKLLSYLTGEKTCELGKIALENNKEDLFKKHLDKAEEAYLNWSDKSMKRSVLKALLHVKGITEQERADLCNEFKLRVAQYPNGSFYAICDEISSFISELRDTYNVPNSPKLSLSQEDIDNRDLNVVGRTVKAVRKVASSLWGGLTSWWS